MKHSSVLSALCKYNEQAQKAQRLVIHAKLKRSRVLGVMVCFDLDHWLDLVGSAKPTFGREGEGCGIHHSYTRVTRDPRGSIHRLRRTRGGWSRSP